MPVRDRQNPFNELYLSEAIDDPALYLRWFSPTIIAGEAKALFRRGNTVLRGSNGVGKTMLLRLFSPHVRASYWATLGHDRWHIPMPNALAIGVNFIHAGFGSLGRRRLADESSVNRQQWALVVGDLLNYYLINQLLTTLLFLQRDGSVVAQRLGADVSSPTLDRFATLLGGNACWFDALTSVRSFQDLCAAVRGRIAAYRSFINWNTKSLPRRISATKTVIGAPVLESRDALSRTGVVPEQVALVVALDQYETLYHTDYADRRHAGVLGRTFCRVINTLLSHRSAWVSYKVGVRHYAWGPELRGLDTDARLEHGRDYQIVDLDEVLKRREDTKAWIFPRFAQDVAERRMAAAFGHVGRGGHADWFRHRLERLEPEHEIARYCRDDPDRLIPADLDQWPPQWAALLRQLYSSSKYDAKLAELWVRQRQGFNRATLGSVPVAGQKGPWEREWWRKERREALLTQIASECAQRRLYSGWDTLLTLSGSNILVFISLCREMWDHWERARTKAGRAPNEMSADMQSQAIRIVSGTWLEKLEEFPRGSTRRAFVVRLGVAMRRALLADKALSYPGHTGFSLTEDELRSDDVVRRFLEDAVDYGALVGFEHTTKERDGRTRRKWYLSPILCPNFEIPAIRTKEPYYARVSEVREWVQGDRIVIGPHVKRRAQSKDELTGWLFDEHGGEE